MFLLALVVNCGGLFHLYVVTVEYDTGFVCGEGATIATEAFCGGQGELFCPEGSSTPTTVSLLAVTFSRPSS